VLICEGYIAKVTQQFLKHSFWWYVNNCIERYWQVDVFSRMTSPVVRRRSDLHATLFESKSCIFFRGGRALCQVCDFGLAKVKRAAAESAASHSKAGTFCWMAPELFASSAGPRQPHSTATDVYSFGILISEASSFSVANGITQYSVSGKHESWCGKNTCGHSEDQQWYCHLSFCSSSLLPLACAFVCVQVLSGRAPFYGQESYNVPGLLRAGQRPEVPSLSGDVLEAGSVQLQELMHQCWAQEPNDRPQTQEVRGLVVPPSISSLSIN
jgi:serine/threonine protein kinase